MGCGWGASGFPVAQGCHLRDGVVDPADPHVARVQAKGPVAAEGRSGERRPMPAQCGGCAGRSASRAGRLAS